MYFVYILKCRDGTLYTGITTDVARRLAEHKAGTASKYTRSRGALKIVYSLAYKGRSTASKEEIRIKNLSRQQKLSLIRTP